MTSHWTPGTYVQEPLKNVHPTCDFIALWAQDNLLAAKTTANPNARKVIVQRVN